MERKGIKKHTVITGLIVAFWLCITLYLLGLFGIHGGWPAFLALIFFTLSGGNTKKLKPIFIGGAVGILMAAGLVVGVEFLIPTIGVGMQTAIYIMVFIAVFLLIILEDLSDTLFNSYAFCYFSVALVPAEQATLEWLITLFLAGVFFVGGIITLLRLVGKLNAGRAK